MANYIPIIKSTQSEMAALDRLSLDIKNKILPLFELTRSRTTRLFPEGDISRSLGKLMAAYSDNDFILDLTAHEDLTNSHIENLLNDENGYAAWCKYVEEIGNKHLIPCVQIVADDPRRYREVTKQVTRLLKSSNQVAFRVSYDDPEIENFLKVILDGLKKPEQLILVLDAGYIRPSQAKSVCNAVKENLNEAVISLIPEKIASVASSSFPRTVNQTGYGDEEAGIFPLEEVVLHRELIKSLNGIKWKYSDYASVHPNRYETKGGNWVPRIDVPLTDKLFFHRHKREKGGYKKCAQEVKKDDLYKNVIECWGKEQIEKCAAGGQVGQSPAFWISVRINIHITTQVQRLMKS